ncbi:MAG: CPBP family glutamic-type intramembrane protease [Myxococcota bacterium]|nr:CPBP family glutamic-type intramembrane protease [Myxococcota bacterium]
MKRGQPILSTHGPTRALYGLALLLVVMLLAAFVALFLEIGFTKLASGQAAEVAAETATNSWGSLAGILGMLFGLWFLCRSTIGNSDFLLGWRTPRKWWFAVFVVSAGSLAEMFYRTAQAVWPGWETGSIEMIRESVQGGGVASALSLVSILLLAPFVEELVFRGWLYSGLVHRLGPARTILCTTVAFMCFHMDPHHSAATVPLGLFLGWLRASTGSVWPCILAHVLNNFLATLGFLELGFAVEAPMAELYLGLIPLGALVWKTRQSLGEPRVLLAQGRWAPEVHNRLQGLLDGPPGLACFDWDNTCIEGDIGDALLWAVDGPDQSLWSAYEEKIAAGRVAEAYGDAVCVLSGRTRAEAQALCQRVYEEGIAAESITRVEEQVSLMAALRQAGWEVWVVSASAEPMVRVAAASYEVPPERVLGIRLMEEEGRFLAQFDGPILYGPGKVQAIMEHIGRYPDLALGDALTDKEMMMSAQHAVLIGTHRTEMVALAQEQGWAVQPRFSEQSA